MVDFLLASVQVACTHRGARRAPSHTWHTISRVLDVIYILWAFCLVRTTHTNEKTATDLKLHTDIAFSCTNSSDASASEPDRDNHPAICARFRLHVDIAAIYPITTSRLSDGLCLWSSLNQNNGREHGV